MLEWTDRCSDRNGLAIFDRTDNRTVVCRRYSSCDCIPRSARWANGSGDRGRSQTSPSLLSSSHSETPPTHFATLLPNPAPMITADTAECMADDIYLLTQGRLMALLQTTPAEGISTSALHGVGRSGIHKGSIREAQYMRTVLSRTLFEIFIQSNIAPSKLFCKLCDTRRRKNQREMCQGEIATAIWPRTDCLMSIPIMNTCIQNT